MRLFAHPLFQSAGHAGLPRGCSLAFGGAVALRGDLHNNCQIQKHMWSKPCKIEQKRWREGVQPPGVPMPHELKSEHRPYSPQLFSQLAKVSSENVSCFSQPKPKPFWRFSSGCGSVGRPIRTTSHDPPVIFHTTFAKYNHLLHDVMGEMELDSLETDISAPAWHLAMPFSCNRAVFSLRIWAGGPIPLIINSYILYIPIIFTTYLSH